MNAKRNRSRSGATTECPECKKKLRGGKGLAAHRKAEHGDEAKEERGARRRLAGKA